MARHYCAPMTTKWRRDLLDAQQLGLPRAVGLLLVVALLSATAVPFPYGVILCAVMLTLLTALLHRNTHRRRQGIDGWPNIVILAPPLFMVSVVLIGTFVSEAVAAVFALVFLLGGSFLLVRRLRRSGEPERSAHHFRGTAPPNLP